MLQGLFGDRCDDDIRKESSPPTPAKCLHSNSDVAVLTGRSSRVHPAFASMEQMFPESSPKAPQQTLYCESMKRISPEPVLLMRQ